MSTTLGLDDRRLIECAAAWPALQALGDCTAEALATVSQHKGIDFATALLYERVCRSEAHGSFIHRLQTGPATHDAIATPLRMVIVPGAFYKDYRHTGADGAPLVAELRRLGYPVDVVPLGGFDSLRRSGELLSGWLARHASSPTVLVSLSKGGADVKQSLASADASETFQQVVAWIDLSGILEGTALVDWLRRRPLRWFAVKWLLWARGYSIATLAELQRGSSATLSAPAPVPPWLTAIHVVGFPLRKHLIDRWARRGHRRLAALGPNDGGGILLADAVARPGLVFPVWGADHYLRPSWDIRRLVIRLVRFVEEKRCPTHIAP